MPFIEESDLLDLHKDLDKSQIINERLLDQIKVKNKELKKSKIQRNVLAVFTTMILIGGLAIFSFTAGLSQSSNAMVDNQHVLMSIDSVDAYRARLETLRKKNDELSLVKEFYLAKKFIENETIYSVQVKSLVDKNLSLTSEGLTNTLLVKNNPFYAYSVGNFETLQEAQTFRRELVKIGFPDAFVASYKDGKRLKIESPN
ncbi:SPOR domain-containing protein [Sediminicola luteus]|uniref:Sporulation protein n=1 Tax=Sediminicola luteus TaxID=319238 RepID=A0A2A4G5G1_9FLAO|nr:SPOR domain-containing protein [Sediminicola luteus]PCE63887.1 sporulation protein [Sediminicola luteus]